MNSVPLSLLIFQYEEKWKLKAFPIFQNQVEDVSESFTSLWVLLEHSA